jgi:predicted secreted protein
MEGLAVDVEVVAHCLLDPLTRVKGLKGISYRPAGPVVQLPCPEALYLGLDRWAVTRNQLEVPEFRRLCRSIATQYADLLEMLSRKGVRIRVVGVARSPSCGVNTTTRGYMGGLVREAAHEMVAGPGAFMEELLAVLRERGVEVSTGEMDAGK